LTFLFSRPFYP